MGYPPPSLSLSLSLVREGTPYVETHIRGTLSLSLSLVREGTPYVETHIWGTLSDERTDFAVVA
jgi:hypothetical protein